MGIQNRPNRRQTTPPPPGHPQAAPPLARIWYNEEAAAPPPPRHPQAAPPHHTKSGGKPAPPPASREHHTTYPVRRPRPFRRPRVAHQTAHLRAVHTLCAVRALSDGVPFPVRRFNLLSSPRRLYPSPRRKPESIPAPNARRLPLSSFRYRHSGAGRNLACPQRRFPGQATLILWTFYPSPRLLYRYPGARYCQLTRIYTMR